MWSFLLCLPQGARILFDNQALQTRTTYPLPCPRLPALLIDPAHRLTRPHGRGLVMSEMRPELTVLRGQLNIVQVTLAAALAASPQLIDGEISKDPLAELLQRFTEEATPKLDSVIADLAAMEAEVKALALYLAEAPSTSGEALVVPIANFITSLEQAHADNLMEIAKEKRKQESERRRSVAELGRPSLRRSFSDAEDGGTGTARLSGTSFMGRASFGDDDEGMNSLREELERRISSRRSFSDNADPDADPDFSPPTSPTLNSSDGRSYKKNYDMFSSGGSGRSDASGGSAGSGTFELPKLRATPKTREGAPPATTVPAIRTTPATFSLPDEREMIVPHRLSSGSRGVNLQMRWLAREESLAMEAEQSPMSSLASPAPVQKDKETPRRNSKARGTGPQTTGAPDHQGRQLPFRRSAREPDPDSPGFATVVGDLTKSITNMFSFGRSS